VELQLIGPNEADPNCRETRNTANTVLNELFELMEASGFSVLMRSASSTRLEGVRAIEQLDLAMDAGSRAIITVDGQCAPLGREEIIFRTTDVAYLRTPSHLGMRLTARTHGQPEFHKAMERFANRLWTLEGAPSGVLGSRIAFSCTIRPGVRDIYSVNSQGADLRRETHFNHVTILPAWGPDGQVAATSYITGDAKIHLGEAPFVHKEGLNTGIDFHKASGRFVFANADDDAQNLYLGNTQNRRILAALTRSKHIDTAPAFSPDGRKIAFVSDRSGSPQIYIMNIKSRRVHRTSTMGSYNTAPAWSPDGANLVWNRQVGGDRNVVVLKNLHENGTTERVFITGAKSYEHPSFSPDGRSIVVAEVEGRKIRIVTIEMRTKKITVLAEHNLPGRCSQTSWSKHID
jgi:TolB protein